MPLTTFQQQGLTQAIVASSAGSAAVQVSTGSQQGMFLANPTTSAVYWLDSTTGLTAAFPTTSTPALGACLPAGLAGPFTTRPGGFLSAATSAGTATIFATPGFGQ